MKEKSKPWTAKQEYWVSWKWRLHNEVNLILSNSGFPEFGNFSKAIKACFKHMLIDKDTADKLHEVNNNGNGVNHEDVMHTLENLST